jgi:riboflavin kinase/FMN adenylyltransferase
MGPAKGSPPQPSFPMTFRGTVVHGDQRGRAIGFPTANVRLQEESLPRFGIYAGRLDGMPAAVSIGVRPTFGHDLHPTLEAHMIGFHGDLYGREVTVTLVERVRDELKFDTVEELIAQIADDVRVVKAILSTSSREK